jgi:hypothetical protein
MRAGFLLSDKVAEAVRVADVQTGTASDSDSGLAICLDRAGDRNLRIVGESALGLVGVGWCRNWALGNRVFDAGDGETCFQCNQAGNFFHRDDHLVDQNGFGSWAAADSAPIQNHGAVSRNSGIDRQPGGLLDFSIFACE